MVVHLADVRNRATSQFKWQASNCEPASDFEPGRATALKQLAGTSVPAENLSEEFDPGSD